LNATETTNKQLLTGVNDAEVAVAAAADAPLNSAVLLLSAVKDSATYQDLG
jgi:hypothetical protein